MGEAQFVLITLHDYESIKSLLLLQLVKHLLYLQTEGELLPLKEYGLIGKRPWHDYMHLDLLYQWETI